MATFEQYLNLEQQAGFKSEFYDGEILAMAGGTLVQSRLCVRLITLLDRLLPDCQVYDSNLKLYIEDPRLGVYPDAMALCCQAKFLEQSERMSS